MTKVFEHFYKHSYADRLAIIKKFSNLNENDVTLLKKSQQANLSDLVENYLGSFTLPEGIAVGLKINGKVHAVPMVTEEPSVIAAACNGAGMLSSGNGIQAKVLNRLLTGQILMKLPHPGKFLSWAMHHDEKLMSVANAAHPSIVKHGGGARGLKYFNVTGEYFSLNLYVDVSEAMGANIMNSMLEAVAHFINVNFDNVTLVSILSNYANHSLTKVTGMVPFARLATKTIDGKTVAKRIAIASILAQKDVHRATTHNKGIMNGIDAVCLAMGNDTRAIEAGAHAYAAHEIGYKGLSTWHVTKQGLIGTMTIPLALGFVGGATNVLPLVKVNQQIAQVHSAKALMKLTASLGLAQNLAALKALCTDGIQHGHMALQMRSLAISAGAKVNEVNEVSKKLNSFPQPTLEAARSIIHKLHCKH